MARWKANNPGRWPMRWKVAAKEIEVAPQLVETFFTKAAARAYREKIYQWKFDLRNSDEDWWVEIFPRMRTEITPYGGKWAIWFSYRATMGDNILALMPELSP